MRHMTRVQKIDMDERLVNVIKLLRTNTFGDCKDWTPLIDSISRGNDYYLVNADFAEYCKIQDVVSETYRDQGAWTRMSLYSIARSGIFSSDRTILQYAKEIWNIEPTRRPGPTSLSVDEMSKSGIVPAEALGVSPSVFKDRKVTVEKSSKATVAKYKSVAENIELGFDPKQAQRSDSDPASL